MAILPILTAPDPILKQVSKPVEAVDDALRALMDDMLETMYAAPGIGLAAIQVGVPKNVIVMDLGPEDGMTEPLYLINPEIIDASEETVVYKEGCLSVPEEYWDVERPASCTVRYLDYNGDRQELSCDGLLATCVQHEMDHLKGILFIDHLSSLKRGMIIRRAQKARRLQAAG